MADPSWTSKAVQKIFTATGLQTMDRIGKETIINSVVSKYQKMSNTQKGRNKIKKEFGDIFGKEIDSLIIDLKNNIMTPNVKFLAFNKLSDFQPISLSEMPEKYLTAGNGRVMYMLKTFTIKQFDIYRREGFRKIFHGDSVKERAEGAKNLIYLGGLLLMANAGADEIKDWMLGRTTDLSDRIIDNIFRIAGFNKYIVWQARMEGLGTAAAKQILPPFKFLNSVFKDVTKENDGGGLEMVNSIPIGGTLYYWWVGRGKTKRKSLLEIRFEKEKKRLNKIKRDYDRSKDKKSFLNENKKDLIKQKQFRKFQNLISSNERKINDTYASKKLTDTSREKRIKFLEKQSENFLEKIMLNEN